LRGAGQPQRQQSHVVSVAYSGLNPALGTHSSGESRQHPRHPPQPLTATEAPPSIPRPVHPLQSSHASAAAASAIAPPRPSLGDVLLEEVMADYTTTAVVPRQRTVFGGASRRERD
jgi:hypothetical protein